MNTRLTAQSTALLALLCGACGSVGKAQKPVDETPPRFVDMQTGVRVEPMLMIPKYSTASGVSTGAGHGSGRMIEGRFLASPFVYWEGNAFRPNQPDSHGVLMGPLLFAGRGVSIDGVVVVARAHKAFWWGDLWERSRQQLVLEPIADASAYRQRLLSLFERREIRGRDLTNEELDLFNLISDFNLAVEFTSQERQTIREFLKAGP